ncbi:MAG: tRNA-dihydrouridine synthase, partial [Thermoguttaceae bacterium]|nr:tRNA-dihydrouridine synthase [Thermoguttaceae bacterium]
SRPEHIAVREMRKHIGWYIHGYRGAARVRDEINRCADAEEVFILLENFFAEL